MRTFSFHSIAKKWLEDKKPYVKLSTFQAYSFIVRKHLHPQFTDVRKISGEAVQGFALAKMAAGLGRKTVKDILLVLGMILRYSSKIGLTQPPQMEVRLPVAATPDAPPILSRSEESRLIRRITASPTLRSLGVLLSLCTGLRIGEICALRWSDIDFRQRCIKVRRTLSRIYDSDMGRSFLLSSSPKTAASARVVPLTGLLSDTLRPFASGAGTYVVSGLQTPLDPGTFRAWYKLFMSRGGFPPLKYHGLRHTFATRCIESGCDCKTLSVILGHRSVSTTFNLYVHPTPDQKRHAVERMLKSLR